VRKVFVSYARANKPDVDQLVEHLGLLSYETWVDSSLRGGQDWWDEILQRIADCDVFMPIISSGALISTACRREFDWADALGKPVLPVAVEPLPQALPRRFSIRQIVDYSKPGQRDRAAVILSGGLATLPSAPPLPEPLPQPPAAPLSYLTDLVDLVSDPNALDHDQQRQILFRLEPALRSVDPEERRGGRAVLERFSSRDDLFFDVGQSVDRLRLLNDQPAEATTTEPRPEPAALPEADPTIADPATKTDPRPPLPTPLTDQNAFGTEPPRVASDATSADAPVPPNPEATAEPKSQDSQISTFRRNSLEIAGAFLVIAAIAGAIGPIAILIVGDGVSYKPVQFFRMLSWIFVGISFFILAWRAQSKVHKRMMVGGSFIALAFALRYALALGNVITPYTYYVLLPLVSLVGIAFGVAVYRSRRVKWSFLLILWGLCGVVATVTAYNLRTASEIVLILQMIVLLAVGILMYVESRRAKNEPTATSANEF
jgi:TIR domain-containing protein